MEGSSEAVYCIHCKTPIADNVMTCPKCGGSQLPGSAPPGAGAPTAPPRRRQVRWDKGRPTGVTVLAVLMLLNGIFGLMGACAMTSLMELAPEDAASAGEVAAAKALFTYVIPLISVFDIVLAVGLLYMKPWARILAIIVSLIGAGLDLLGMATGGVGIGPVISLAINGFVAFYLIILGPEFADYYED